MSLVFLGIPSYDGRVSEAMPAMLRQATLKNQLYWVMNQSYSILTHNFNKIYAEALNARKDGVTHFCMLHEDILPLESGFVDRMLEIMAREKCEVLSVVSPIKDMRGLTSTGVDTDDPWAPRRYTMKEVFAKPATWSEPNLLINTGLMLVDIRGDWAESVHFYFDDVIQKCGDKFVAKTRPEDWNFSRLCHKAGVKVCATREIPIHHLGRAQFTNTQAWGQWETDTNGKDAA